MRELCDNFIEDERFLEFWVDLDFSVSDIVSIMAKYEDYEYYYKPDEEDFRNQIHYVYNKLEKKCV